MKIKIQTTFKKAYILELKDFPYLTKEEV